MKLLKNGMFCEIEHIQGKLIKSKCIHGSLISRRKDYLKIDKTGQKTKYANSIQYMYNSAYYFLFAFFAWTPRRSLHSDK